EQNLNRAHIPRQSHGLQVSTATGLVPFDYTAVEPKGGRVGRTTFKRSSKEMAKKKTRWNERPVRKDYTAALNYLTLQFSTAAAQRLVKKARGVRPTEHIAKDILRASN